MILNLSESQDDGLGVEMGKAFLSKRRIKGVRNGGGIYRVTNSPFAIGEDNVSCCRFAIGRGMKIGHVDGLHSGDVIKVYPDGKITRLWDARSIHNCLFVTEACNFRCVMCPQPPTADSPEHHADNLRILRLMSAKSAEMIGITGGEPTLFPDRLIEYFNIINERFPAARVEILTNGSLLSNFGVAKKLALAAPLNTCFCVSIHGDTAGLAESIMHCHGGWDNAIRGILNLAKLQQQIELRLVLTQKNIPFLSDIGAFFYRNFPFVSHVAMMGQEIVGEAERNYAETWIEPSSYGEALADAATYLDSMQIPVSIYNIPLCLLPERCWRFAEKSISDWKQNYRHECVGCKRIEECCGFFTTSREFVPHGIHPLAL